MERTRQTSNTSTNALKSDPFYIKEEEFMLDLYPQGHCEATKGFVSGFLERRKGRSYYSGSFSEVSVSYKIIVTSGSKKIAACEHQEKDIYKIGDNWGYPELVSHQILEEHLKDDQLTITVTLTLHGKDIQRSSKHCLSNAAGAKNAAHGMLENLWIAYQDQIFCDFTIVSKEGKQFPCHKVVLASGSPVLKKLLNSGLKESKENKMEARMYDSDLLSVILKFMYKGVIEDDKLKARTKEVFMAANFYEMTHLKDVAEVELIKQMSLKNMLQMFLLADLHDAKELRLSSKNLIIENIQELMKDVDWKRKLSESNEPDLVFEILEGVADYGRPAKRTKFN